MNSSRGQKPGPTGNGREDEDGPWRHPPIAPKDAGIADSLGESVSDVVTGPLEEDSEKATKPAPKPVQKS
jgi:hypothetical protein